MLSRRANKRRCHEIDCRRPRAALVVFRTQNVHMVRESEALVIAGYDVEVLCLRGADETPPQDDAHIRFHTVVIDRHRSNLLRYALSYLKWFVIGFVFLSRGQLRSRYAVVQINSLPDHQVFTALIPKLLGVPVVLFLKEPSSLLFGSVFDQRLVAKAMSRIELWAISFADLTFTVTEAHRTFYVERGAAPDKIQVVVNSAPSGLFPLPSPIERDRDLEKKPVTIISPGTIETRWGHPTMLRAVAKARVECEHLRYIIAGEGQGTEEVLTLIDELGLSDIVTYVGMLDIHELADHYRRADIGITAQVVSPYAQLVHTMKMYEYMLTGVAVISSRMQSTMSYFSPSAVTYFDAGDVDQLARAIVDLASDPELRANQVAQATIEFEPYRWEAQQELYLSHIDAAVSSTGRGRRRPRVGL